MEEDPYEQNLALRKEGEGCILRVYEDEQFPGKQRYFSLTVERKMKGGRSWRRVWLLINKSDGSIKLESSEDLEVATGQSIEV